MIAVDTNVIVRLLTGDDESQYRAAHALFQQHDIFIPKTVVLETEWVLRYTYEFSTEQIVDAFQALFGLENVELEDEPQVATALEWRRQGLDFADALHLAAAQAATQFATFDRQLSRKAVALSPLVITIPE